MNQRCLIFCRVIDNFGDAGVCCRLARHLVEQGWGVDLVADRPEIAGRMMAKQDGFGLQDWPGEPPSSSVTVVISAFGCDLPQSWREHMTTPLAAQWVHLEYLSAEAWIDSHHGLVSYKPDGARSLFFFPGYTPGSGGVLHSPTEKGHFAKWGSVRQARQEVLQLIPQPSENVEAPWSSLFCYPGAALQGWTQALEVQAATTWVASGVPVQVSGQMLGDSPGAQLSGKHHRWVRLPWLTQHDYDLLLAACDFNVVRGEDSWVRAQLAGRPFAWQPYRQAERLHAQKSAAFVQLVQQQCFEHASSLGRWSDLMAWWTHDDAQFPPQIEWEQLLRPEFTAAFRCWAEHLWAQPSLTLRLEHAIQKAMQKRAKV